VSRESSPLETEILLENADFDRWQIHQRLQELEIHSVCRSFEPLRVHVSGAIAAIQVWSVARHVVMQRQELVHWLNSLWSL
jgi:hypothetical protein